MSGSDFFTNEEHIKDLVFNMGYSICSNTIVKDGLKVGFMYREEPLDEEDSGWRFLSGTETEDYVDDPDNSKIYGVNTVANHDPAIIPYLTMAIGAELERLEGSDKFQELE